MSKMKSTAEQKKLSLLSILPEIVLIIPKTFGLWKILFGLARQKLNFLESVCPKWCKSNRIFQKRHIITAVKHGGGCVMAWGCFAVLGPGRLAVIN